MKAIVVVDKNWGIGKDNKLLFRLPPDMEHFKKETVGKVVVMGGKTLRSLPDGKPLPSRTNIVLSKSLPDSSDYIRAETLEELKTILRRYNTDSLYIIGGASFYATMLPYCNEILVTKVDADGQPTVYFPNLDKNSGFTLEEKGKEMYYDKYSFCFCVYKNKFVQDL